VAEGINALANVMQEALERGEKFYVTGAGAADAAGATSASAAKRPNEAGPPAFNRPVYVIVPVLVWMRWTTSPCSRIPN
jgi:hypothetical protein